MLEEATGDLIRSGDTTGTKICDDKMPLAVEQYILWLQVTMNNATIMQPFNRQHEFSHIEPCLVFRHR